MTWSSARRARAGAAVSGAVGILCVAVLVGDYAAARGRLDDDTSRVAALQSQARGDAGAARTLEAEQARITRARLARTARTEWAGLLLIAASTGFIGFTKWRIAQGPRRPAAPPQPSEPIPLVRRGPAPPLDAARAVPAESDLAVVERIIRREGTDSEAAIRILQAIQAHYRYLPDAALAIVCERTTVTPAQIAGTSSFYARFRRSPVGDRVIRVCHGTACHVSGARHITDELRRCLRIPEGGDTDPERRFTIDEVACVGCCSLAPVVMVDEQTAGRLTPDAVRALVGAPAGKDAR
jgi:NADH:ubiquinone oxidoreductase subunit E